ncbi:hypothetical protein [Nocardiopsis ansamitocini]|uniref:Uncharacterized protein n=1 Tax=Nocardiopsis ansamitocini TaxID=1670832 RepID=A0A9W6P9B6_9ACTN|nr:hypothetical protein [Nocardiopsis ansamitocini]GLU49363.1 hypothetical protein Nans01_37140 [Nocardiopsis ansamitocini]
MSRRRTDWASLTAGLLFVMLGLAFVVQGSTGWWFSSLWLLPVLGAGLVAVGTVRTVGRYRERRELRRQGGR